MDTALVVTVVAAFVVAFLRLVPKGADLARLRTFNWQALVLLAAICGVAVGVLYWRLPSLESARFASETFVSVFVPLYVFCAAALRSRSLAPHTDGGRVSLRRLTSRSTGRVSFACPSAGSARAGYLNR